MVSTNERRERSRLVGMLLCACLVLQPLLLFGHLILDDHCWHLEISEHSELVEMDLAHFGFAPHRHEEGCHHQGVAGHEDEAPAHPERCPLSVEEHLESLVGDPAWVRSDATRRVAFLQLALESASPPVIRRPAEWRHRWDGRESASRPRVEKISLCPRAPPAA